MRTLRVNKSKLAKALGLARGTVVYWLENDMFYDKIWEHAGIDLRSIEAVCTEPHGICKECGKHRRLMMCEQCFSSLSKKLDVTDKLSDNISESEFKCEICLSDATFKHIDPIDDTEMLICNVCARIRYGQDFGEFLKYSHTLN